MIINHNMNAANANRQMSTNQAAAGRSMEKLSSGLRINKAGDDAAGLSISEKMRSQVRGLEQAGRNAQDSISLIQTAEGGLNETHAILQRMRELAVQASNDTNVSVDRGAIKNELNQLSGEIDHIAQSTNFNGRNLLSSSDTLTFQIGSTDQTYDKISLNMSSIKAGADQLTVASGDITVDSSANATTTITNIDKAIETVSQSRSLIGSYQNRLEHTINNLSTEAENMTAAESRIRDVDMAKEMMTFSKNNILNQAAQSMMAQANQQPQAVLSLLR